MPKRIYLLLILTAALSIFTLIKKTSAVLLDPHAYAMQGYMASLIQGGSMTLDSGQEDLVNNSTSTNIVQSINKEMWLNFDFLGDCWIEVGQKKGGVLRNLVVSEDPINQINWAGHFIGYSLMSPKTGYIEFHATPYSASSPTGKHNYQIALTNSTTSEWKVYVNGYQALTISNAQCPGRPTLKEGVSLTAGIESKDDTNNFKSGTSISNFRYLPQNSSTWQLVTQTQARNFDSNPYNGMKSSFSYSTTPSPNNRITLTHN